MRHCPSVPSPCQPYTIVILLALSLGLPSPSRAQAAIGLGFTRQRVSAGNRRESLNGYNAAVVFRLAPGSDS